MSSHARKSSAQLVNRSQSRADGVAAKANGAAVRNGGPGTDDAAMQELRQELERTKLEKETLEGQYRTLLDRLTEMKTKIALKLQQDAEELERREAAITGLNARNDELENTVTSLHTELSASNTESDRVTREMDALRNKLNQHQQSSSLAHSSEIASLTSEAHALRDQLKESQELLERGRLEKEEWERILMEERVAAEVLRTEKRALSRELDVERSKRIMFEDELREEKERGNNLESVLTEFEAGQDKSIASAKETYTSQIDTLTQSLAEYKSRALNAEVELGESKNSAPRVKELEAELKEKSVLLTKVRQEAVTLNEHLIQALRRLRKFSADPSSSGGASANAPSYVDRRLVTNILLQFLTTPRADRKRYEMLSLLGSILGWGDDEKEKAGLQRSSGTSSPMSATGSNTPRVKAKEDEKNDESFSNMWVEFLLKEAGQGSSSTYGGGTPTSQKSQFSPSVFTPSAYAPSNYAKSNYAASEAGGGPSPTNTFSSLPPLPPLSGEGSNGLGHPSNSRSISGAFRLPSLSRTKSPAAPASSKAETPP